MSGVLLYDDYLDPDVAYLLGMIVARGTLIEDSQTRRIIIEFPYLNPDIEVKEMGTGLSRTIDVSQSIELGLTRIRERVLELLDCDIRIERPGKSVHLIMIMTRRTIAWRNIVLQLNNKVNHRFMNVPESLFHPSISTDIRMEFIRGYADVAGNVRPANNYRDGRNRVRLDVLNDNWGLPAQICRLLQLYLEIPVQNIIWGHPNLGRGIREHQINIFVTPFERVGFSFAHKQLVLADLIDRDRNKSDDYRGCPGKRMLRGSKAFHKDENSERLPIEVRKHFDTYWQICKACGCTIEPPQGALFGSVEDEEE